MKKILFLLVISLFIFKTAYAQTIVERPHANNYALTLNSIQGNLNIEELDSKTIQLNIDLPQNLSRLLSESFNQPEIFTRYYARETLELNVGSGLFSNMLSGPDELAMKNTIATEKLDNGEVLYHLAVTRGEWLDSHFPFSKSFNERLILTFDEKGMLVKAKYIEFSQTYINGFWDGQYVRKGKERITKEVTLFTK
mgnify:CR=1 FL=1